MRLLSLTASLCLAVAGLAYGQTPRLNEAERLNAQGRALVSNGKPDEALPLLRRALEIWEADLGPEHVRTAAVRNNLALAYQARGEYDLALPLFRHAVQTAERASPADPAALAKILINLSSQYADLDRYSEALASAQRALTLSEDMWGPESPAARTAILALVAVQWRMGAYADALALSQRALEFAESYERPDSPEIATILNDTAAIYTSLGAYQEAVPLFQRALEIRDKAADARGAGVVVVNLVELYVRQKEFDKAWAVLFRDHAISIGGGALDYLIAQSSGDPRKALEAAERLRPTDSSTPAARIRYFSLKGLALAKLGERGEAADVLRQAIDEVETLRQRVAGDRTGFFRVGSLGGYIRAYRELVSVLVEMSARKEPLPERLRSYGPDAASAAFYVAEATKARSLLETMAGAARRVQDPALPSAIGDEERLLTSNLAALDASWEQAFQGGAEVWGAHQARRAALRQQLDTLVARLRREYPLYAALHYPQPLPVRDVPLKADEVLLEYAIGDEASAVVVVRAGRAPTVVRIPLGREALEGKVKTFMGPLLNAQGAGFSTALARELFDVLCSQALADVPAGSPVLVVPDGILGLLPFEALAVEAGATLEQTAWAGDRYAIRYYQSATVLALQRQLAGSTPIRPLFALGNPVFATDDPRALAAAAVGRPASAPVAAAPPPEAFAFQAYATRRAWGKTTKSDPTGDVLIYPPLPETATEVQTIAGLFGVRVQAPDVLMNLQANETELRKAPLGTYRYLHFATHADLPGRAQGIREPFILLGQVGNAVEDDGFLTLSEVLGLKLSADLVVLSACVTGRGTVMEGEGVGNFARAFEQAGARAVIVSLWEVASAPAVEFMTRFYQVLRAGQTRAAALRTARNAIKAKYPNPYFWAVFILHGEG